MADSKIIIVSVLFIINLLNYMDRYSIAGIYMYLFIYFKLSSANIG